ncbi:helix-turn-helix domain-containing protein [Sorangium sp. So ce307]
MVRPMTTGTQRQVRRRRRGQQLEADLLDATWEELVQVGFANLTMESVAARARTGIAVLYRRWANKDELVFAAIEHRRDANPVAVPDTGATSRRAACSSTCRAISSPRRARSSPGTRTTTSATPSCPTRAAS